LVAALVVAGLAVFALLAVDLKDSYKSFLEKARLQSSNLGLLLAERITGTLNETDYVLRDVAGRALPFFGSRHANRRKPELARILSQKGSTLAQVSSLILYDASGNFLASSDGRSDGGAADRRFLQAFAASIDLDSYASRVFRAANGRYAVTLARSIRDAHGTLLAVAVAEIDTDYFQKELSRLDVGSGGFVGIFDAGLRIVAEQPAHPGMTGAEPPDVSMFELLRAFTKHNGPGAATDSEGRERYYSIRACQDYPFFVVVANARSEALAVWTLRLAIYGSAAALICVLFVLLARRVAADLRRSEQLAHYDVLTGLPNRALYFDRLSGAVARAKREGNRFALLYVDLDGFKPINDRFGHACGDLVLRETARRLKSAIRDSDTAARMGGDEFTVLLDHISRAEDAMSVAEKIGAAIAEPIVLPEERICKVRASVGFAIFPDDADEGETLLKFADEAMYAQKRQNAAKSRNVGS
jgi:diguanylate cyclase (GGDEF)-like protein